MVVDAPFVVLKGFVPIHGLSVSPGEERTAVSPGKDWPRIKICRKKADGCGNHGHKFLEGLTLYLQSDSAADLGSLLSVSLSDEARRSIEAELGVNPGAGPGLVLAEGVVKVVAEQLLIISLSFSVINYSDREYYLVYDSADASIYMIPSIPLGFVTSFTAAPLPRFTGVGRDHELVLLARRRWLQLNNNHRVCVCTPETRASAECDDNSTSLWQVKKRCFPELPYPFSVDEVFSFQGKLFWADLSQGLVYCDDLRSGESAVEFSFVSLPRGYVVDAHEVQERLDIGRTISCNGGCIQFVCIDRHSSRPGGHSVNVWTLDLDTLQWKDQEGFPCPWKEIWGQQAGFMDAEARDVVVAQYPVVTPGGALCLLLSNMPQKPGYICSFDMGSKKLLWSGTVRDYGTTRMIGALRRAHFIPVLRLSLLYSWNGSC